MKSIIHEQEKSNNIYLIKTMNKFCLRLFKYHLIPFSNNMRHSMFDFILDRENIQTINKQKTQDYYHRYAIIQKQFRLIWISYYSSWIFFYFVTKGINDCNEAITGFSSLFNEKNNILSKMSTLELKSKKK